MELFIHLGRTVIYYICLVLLVRFLGKREIGKLGVFDLVVLLMVANIACVSIENIEIPYWYFIVIIVCIAVIQKFVSFLEIKIKGLRNTVDGMPSIIIFNGKINVSEMKKNLYNIDDLMMQLRGLTISNVQEVKMAILDINGVLSAYKYEDTDIIPLPIISSGSINEQYLYYFNVTKDEILDKIGNRKLSDILCAYYNDNNLIIVDTFEYIFKKNKGS